jgi:hypothetical protein
VPAGVRLAAVALLGTVVYAGACYWRAPDVVAELRRLRLSVARRRSAEPILDEELAEAA